MNKIKIKIGNSTRTVQAPESWDDLDARTALMVYNTLFSGLGDDLTRGAFTAVKLISLTQHLLAMPPDFLAKWEADCIREDAENGDLVFLEELKQVMVATLAGLFDVVTDAESGATGYAVKFNRTKNPWPALTTSPPAPPSKGGRKRAHKAPKWYYGPKDGLANLTLYELGMTFGVYEEYLETRDEAKANELIAVLYRPSRPETQEERDSAWHGDRRQPYRRYEDKATERMKMVATLPALTRRFLIFWFAGCREAIVRDYPKVFKKGKDAGGPNYGWGGLLLGLAETGTFGALGETADQHYSNALTYLSMKEDERVEMERKIDEIKGRR